MKNSLEFSARETIGRAKRLAGSHGFLLASASEQRTQLRSISQHWSIIREILLCNKLIVSHVLVCWLFGLCWRKETRRQLIYIISCVTYVHMAPSLSRTRYYVLLPEFVKYDAK